MLKFSIEKQLPTVILNPTWPIIIKLKKVDQQEIAKQKSTGNSFSLLGLIIEQAPSVLSQWAMCSTSEAWKNRL